MVFAWFGGLRICVFVVLMGFADLLLGFGFGRFVIWLNFGDLLVLSFDYFGFDVELVLDV